MEGLDRTRLYAIEHDAQVHRERQAMDHVAHYQALGIGLAALCRSLYDGLEADTRFTHRELVEIVKAAVQGR